MSCCKIKYFIILDRGEVCQSPFQFQLIFHTLISKNFIVLFNDFSYKIDDFYLLNEIIFKLLGLNFL